MGCGVLIQDRERQDVATRAHKDVFMASPEARHHTPVAGSTDRKFMSMERSCTVIPRLASLLAWESKVRWDSNALDIIRGQHKCKPEAQGRHLFVE
jgi:hypothetical protein